MNAGILLIASCASLGTVFQDVLVIAHSLGALCWFYYAGAVYAASGSRVLGTPVYSTGLLVAAAAATAVILCPVIGMLAAVPEVLVSSVLVTQTS